MPHAPAPGVSEPLPGELGRKLRLCRGLSPATTTSYAPGPATQANHSILLTQHSPGRLRTYHPPSRIPFASASKLCKGYTHKQGSSENQEEEKQKSTNKATHFPHTHTHVRTHRASPTPAPRVPSERQGCAEVLGPTEGCCRPLDL